MVLSQPTTSLRYLKSPILEALLSLLKRDIVAVVSDVMDSCGLLRGGAH